MGGRQGVDSLGCARARAHVPFICGVALALLAVCCGCTGPSLRAMNPREAKIDVYATGEVRVYGEPVALGDLAACVRRSSTRPQDTILVRLHGDPESPAFTQLRRQITDQMLRAEHYKFNFFSIPLATVQTYDPAARRTETYAENMVLAESNVANATADTARLIEEQKAYREGTYVSEAALAKPIAVAVGQKPEELKVGGELLPEAKRTAPQPATPQRDAPAAVPAQEDLRDQWKRQQRRAKPVNRSVR